jgi:hypothetical protein
MYTVRMKYETISGGAVSTVYMDGSPALLVDNHVVSINLSQYGLVPPAGHVFVKDYSEHEGLADALVDAGLVEKVNEVSFGYGKGWLCKIVGEVRHTPVL